MMKSRLLWKGIHGSLLQGIQLIIKIGFWEHSALGEIGNLIGISAIQWMLLYERLYTEENIFWIIEHVLYSGPEGQNEINFDFQCIIGFHSKSVDFTNEFSQADIPIGETVFIELPRYFKSDGGKYDVVLRLKKTYMTKANTH